MMLAYNAVAYTELIRQGEGGEVIKIRWWFTKGADLKSMYAGKRKGPFQHLLTIGRRDFFLLAWVVFALANAKGLIALYAFIVALANFGVAVGQVLWRWRGALSAFSWYARDLASWNKVHGSIAAVVVFLFWVYISAVILLYGVEMTAAYARIRSAAARHPELAGPATAVSAAR